MADKPSLVLFIADALRRDFWPTFPGADAEVGVMTAGPNSPAGIPALVTGQSPDEHGVTWFHDEVRVPTVFDLEQWGYDVSYYDHPADVMYSVLGHPPRKRLADLEEPFVYVERATETHTPYGLTWRDLEDAHDVQVHDTSEGRVYPECLTGGAWENGEDYIELMCHGDIDWLGDYRAGRDLAYERFNALLDTLYMDLDCRENTVSVFTADHGEAFGGPIGWDDCRHTIHNDPGCDHVNKVKATFYGDVDPPHPMRQVDILAEWDEEWRGGRDGLEMMDREPNPGWLRAHEEGVDKERLRDLGYL